MAIRVPLATGVAAQLTNVTDPSQAQDAATKNYVDSRVSAAGFLFDTPNFADQLINGNNLTSFNQISGAVASISLSTPDATTAAQAVSYFNSIVVANRYYFRFTGSTINFQVASASIAGSVNVTVNLTATTTFTPTVLSGVNLQFWDGVPTTITDLAIGSNMTSTIGVPASGTGTLLTLNSTGGTVSITSPQNTLVVGGTSAAPTLDVAIPAETIRIDTEIANKIGSATTRTQLSNGTEIVLVVINQIASQPVTMTVTTRTDSTAILATLNAAGANATTISNAQTGGNTLLVQSWSAQIFQIVAHFPPATTLAQVQALFSGARSDSVFYGGPTTGQFTFVDAPKQAIANQFVAGSNITLTQDANRNVTIASTGGGSSGNIFDVSSSYNADNVGVLTRINSNTPLQSAAAGTIQNIDDFGSVNISSTPFPPPIATGYNSAFIGISASDESWGGVGRLTATGIDQIAWKRKPAATGAFTGARLWQVVNNIASVYSGTDLNTVQSSTGPVTSVLFPELTHSYASDELGGKADTVTTQPFIDSRIATKIGSAPTTYTNSGGLTVGNGFGNAGTTATFISTSYVTAKAFLQTALIGAVAPVSGLGNWTLPSWPILISNIANPTSTQFGTVTQIQESSATQFLSMTISGNAAYFAGFTTQQPLYFLGNPAFVFQDPPKNAIQTFTVAALNGVQGFASLTSSDNSVSINPSIANKTISLTTAVPNVAGTATARNNGPVVLSNVTKTYVGANAALYSSDKGVSFQVQPLTAYSDTPQALSVGTGYGFGYNAQTSVEWDASSSLVLRSAITAGAQTANIPGNALATFVLSSGPTFDVSGGFPGVEADTYPGFNTANIYDRLAPRITVTQGANLLAPGTGQLQAWYSDGSVGGFGFDISGTTVVFSGGVATVNFNNPSSLILGTSGVSRISIWNPTDGSVGLQTTLGVDINTQFFNVMSWLPNGGAATTGITIGPNGLADGTYTIKTGTKLIFWKAWPASIPANTLSYSSGGYIDVVVGSNLWSANTITYFPNNDQTGVLATTFSGSLTGTTLSVPTNGVDTSGRTSYLKTGMSFVNAGITYTIIGYPVTPDGNRAAYTPAGSGPFAYTVTPALASGTATLTNTVASAPNYNLTWFANIGNVITAGLTLDLTRSYLLPQYSNWDNHVTLQYSASPSIPNLQQVTTKGNSTNQNIVFNDTQASPNSVTLGVPSAVTTSYALKLPAAQGAANTVLANDGSGNLSWSVGGSGSNTTVYSTIPYKTSGGGQGFTYIDFVSLLGTNLATAQSFWPLNSQFTINRFFGTSTRPILTVTGAVTSPSANNYRVPCTGLGTFDIYTGDAAIIIRQGSFLELDEPLILQPSNNKVGLEFDNTLALSSTSGVLQIARQNASEGQGLSFSATNNTWQPTNFAGNWLTGSGTPADSLGQIGSYYQDTSVTFPGNYVWLKTQTATSPYWVRQPNLENAIKSYTLGTLSFSFARVVATANITLSGLQTIDGTALTAGDIVLATAQTSSSVDNGLYVVSSGGWVRASTTIVAGLVVVISLGTINRGNSFIQTLPIVTVGVSPQSWTLFSSAGASTLQAVCAIGSTTTSSMGIGGALTVGYTALNNSNTIVLTGTAAGSSPTIAALGTDTNIGLNISPKGTASTTVGNTTGASGITVLGGQTTYAQLTAAGFNTNLDLYLAPKGSGNVNIGGTAFTNLQVAGGSTASLTLSPIGSSTNLELIVRPKGTGNVTLGSPTATGFSVVGGLTSAAQLQAQGNATDIDVVLLAKGLGNYYPIGNSLGLPSTQPKVYYASARSSQTLGIGAAGQALLSNGATSSPYWGVPLSGAAMSVFTASGTATQGASALGLSNQFNNLGLTFPAGNQLAGFAANATYIINITFGWSPTTAAAVNAYLSVTTSASIVTSAAYGTGASVSNNRQANEPNGDVTVTSIRGYYTTGATPATLHAWFFIGAAGTISTATTVSVTRIA